MSLSTEQQRLVLFRSHNPKRQRGGEPSPGPESEFMSLSTEQQRLVLFRSHNPNRQRGGEPSPAVQKASL